MTMGYDYAEEEYSSDNSVRILLPSFQATVLIVTLVSAFSTPVSLSFSIKVDIWATELSLESNSRLVFIVRVFFARTPMMTFFQSSKERRLPLNLHEFSG
jgi:hypothetical protein